MKKRTFVGALFAMGAAAALSFTSSASAAGDWPQENITLVVPYAAGGTTDILSRRVADLLQGELGKPVIVENRPGAGSTVATAQLTRARDPNYRILMASPGHTIGAAIYPGLRYDPVNDFRFIRNVINIPNVLVVPANSPFNSVADVVKAAREKDGMAFSSSGVGSSIHMSGELFKSMIHGKMVHVPFRGSGEALPALISGDVDLSFENLPSVLPSIKGGQLKALAVTTAHPSPYLPGVPTIAEAGKDLGLADYQTSAWFGLIANKKMSDEAVTKLQAALNKVMASDAFKQFLPQIGAEPATEQGEAFKEFVAKDVKKWAAVAEEAGIRRN
ncbi:Bug family tripartite tricarboxylate transporter substrate binding protein [Gallaecimonas pentaromativorans]|uniref:Bug family tripartite tricarboxylate transporter substrate binding protein n=1 Tax=Gallaecimonas pentaromativorans TaxID=584787 RepID=UPI003A8E1AB3